MEKTTKSQNAVRYQCVAGYIDADPGEYKIGETIEGIGEVQYIEKIEDCE